MLQDKKGERKIRKKERWTEYLILVTQLGLTVIGSILFCFAIGYYLDKWLHIKGVFTTIFIILGIIGGAYTAYRQILEVEDGRKKISSKRSKKISE